MMKNKINNIVTNKSQGAFVNVFKRIVTLSKKNKRKRKKNLVVFAKQTSEDFSLLDVIFNILFNNI